jgi:pilus assembly protein CpaB
MDRQRIIYLFAAAALMAGLLSWFLYANTIAPHPLARTNVIAVVHDMQVGQMIHKADLKKVAVLPADVPKGAIVSEKDALDRVALYPLNANTPLVGSSLSQLAGADGIPATITPGYRAVSITITDVSGVAGLIQPGAHVDVLFTRPGTMAEAITSTILQNVKVLAIGHIVQLGQAVDPKAPKVPVATLIVTPDDAQKLELAKNQGRISLSLRNPLDASAGVDGHPVNADVLDPSLKAKVAMTKLRNSAPDPKIMGVLTEKPKPEVVVPVKPLPPPAPRAVIDVFRGEKHVQEVFHD